MRVTGYCVGGQLSSRDPARWQAQLDDNRRMVDEPAAIGASCLVAIGGGLDEGDRDLTGARRRSLTGFAKLLPHSRAAGVVLALEPLHPMVCASRSVLCTLAQANDWCDELDAGRIAAYHISDWLPDTRDLRFDRGMPGDGVIALRHFSALVAAAGYRGAHDVEILSKRWWATDPEVVVATVKERFASLM
jgi:sugar phosphate isomerase/epimerase